MPREVCYRCRKPARHCLCARVPSLAARTALLVLQHPRERFHPVGTARLARLGLAGAELREVAGAVARPPLRDDAALLFPGPGARDLAGLPADERPGQLVVLDGTWRQARRLFRENAWLARLPRVAFTPAAPSRYRIRRQPAAHCVSTLEAVVAALRLIEPEGPDLAGLLDAFDAMVDEQAAYMHGGGAAPRHQRRRPRPSRALPAELRARPHDLLVLYGETAPLDPPRAGRRRQLLRWTALRPATGAVFDALLQPAGRAPPAAQLAPMGLAPDDLARARPQAEVAAAWRAFLRADDLLLGWHPAQLRLLGWLDPAPPPAWSLKTLWANVSGAAPGGLDERAAAELPAPLRAPLPGRAGRRLASTAALTGELLARAPRLARVGA